MSRQQPPRSARPGRRSQRGAATLESVGMVMVAAIIVVAVIVAATPQGKKLGETFAYQFCKVVTFGQGSCTPPSTTAEEHKPDVPCVTNQSSTSADFKVAVTFVTLKNGKHITIETMSDGTYRVTVSDSGGVGAEVGVGGGVNVTVMDNSYGASASASAGAAIEVKAGDVYYSDAGGLNDLMRALTEDGVKDAIAGQGGPLRWLTDQASGLVGANHSLPTPDETYAEGGISFDASAEATGGVESASAGISGSEMLGVRTKKDGSRTFYIKSHVEGEAGIQALGGNAQGNPEMQGAKISGSGDIIDAVTFDSNGNLVSIQSTTVAAGEGQGFAAALFGGETSASLGDSSGAVRVFQATLPVTNEASANEAWAHLSALGVSELGGMVNPLLGAGSIPAHLGLYQSAANNGTLTQQDYDLSSTTYGGVSASAELGLQLGVDASVKGSEMNTTGAKYWDGSQWVDWAECAA